MNDFFALRFNLQKCGYDSPYSTALLGSMFGQTAEFTAETLAQYDEINSAAAKEIAQRFEKDAFAPLSGKRLLFTGDSNTSDRLSYGKIVEKVLPCDVFDGAVSGTRSTDLAANIERIIDTCTPDIVSVQIGANDATYTDKEYKNTATSLPEFERNLRIIAEKVQKRGIRLIIHSLPPVFAQRLNKNHAYWSAGMAENKRFSDVCRKVADETGAIFHDFRHVFLNDTAALFEPDGIHLTPACHKLLAEEYLKMLRGNLI